MSSPSFAERVVLIEEALSEAAIPHAFGGALAYAYYGEPRATDDIDVNVFLGVEDRQAVLTALATLGVDVAVNDAHLERDGQCRLAWGPVPVDLFFAYDPVHDAMRSVVRRVPFGDAVLPILSPEHLMVCKVVFDRDKDWIDIDQMLIGVSDLDHAEVDLWLDRLVGPDDQRRPRLDTARRRLLGGDEVTAG